MKQNKETLKEFFETGDKPTQEQYSDLIDSYIDSQQEAGEANRRFVIDETGEVSVASALETPEYTLSEITNNKIALLKDGEIATEIDLTSYIDDTNLARLVSGSVDENGLATFIRDDNSEFTLDLSSLGQELSFADENGNIQYTSDTDKRTGYYDVDNKIYYPNITPINEGYFTNFIITNSDKLSLRQTSTYGGASFDFASGFTFEPTATSTSQIQISTELSITTNTAVSDSTLGAKIQLFGKLKNTSEGYIWENTQAKITSGDLSDYIVKVFFGEVNGKFFIGASIREGLNTYKPTTISFNNTNVYVDALTIHYKISDFYNSIEPKVNVFTFPSTATSNPDLFLEVHKEIEYNDMIPQGKVNIHDSNGTLLATTNIIKLGAGLGFNTDTNEIYIE